MLEIVPIFQKEANAFVAKYHRHHKRVVGSVFQIACSAEYDACNVKTRQEIKVYEIVGVAIVGRPVSRKLQDGWTLEVNRCCTDGTKNACSMLYAAAWRITKNMGYNALITYILNTEPGTSLRAAGWKLIGEAGGGNWNVKGRPRVDSKHQGKKLLYAIGDFGLKTPERPRINLEHNQTQQRLFEAA